MSLIRRMDFEGSVAVLCRCHVMVCQIPKVGMYSRNRNTLFRRVGGHASLGILEFILRD